jgi:hypothetical protein
MVQIAGRRSYRPPPSCRLCPNVASRLPTFFSRVDVCENKVHCNREKGGVNASYTQATIESPTLCPKLKHYPTQHGWDDYAMLEDW